MANPLRRFPAFYGREPEGSIPTFSRAQDLRQFVKNLVGHNAHLISDDFFEATGGTSTFTYAASGTAICGGAAAVSKSRGWLASGTATGNGVAPHSWTRGYLASGGAVGAGAASTGQIRTFTHTATGTAIGGGTAPHSHTRVYLVSGGALGVGAALTSYDPAGQTGSGGVNRAYGCCDPRRNDRRTRTYTTRLVTRTGL